MRSRSASRKFLSLLIAGPRSQALVIEAMAGLLAARIALWRHPFAQVARGLGEFVPPGDPRAVARAPVDRDTARTIRRIGWAVRATAPFMPFRAVCLQQAIAAHSMLRRRGIASVMHFGAGRGETKPLDAHAWLDVAGLKVVGFPIAPNLTEIGCFV